MTLTTHAIVGAAAAKLFPQHFLTAFAAGFLSHFLIDAVPHWDYHLRSYTRDEKNSLNNDMVFGFNFILDILNISFDFFLALVLPFLLFGFLAISQPLILLSGIIGGVSPDFLQFVYFKWRHEPMVSLQKFHQWIHTENKLKDWKFGIASQITIILFVVWISDKISF